MENVEEMVDETIENEAADTQTAENPSGETEGGEQEETCEECSSEEEAEEETEEAEKEKKGFFKKKKDKKDEQIEELTDKVKRQMAEFENFRKRSEKEKSQMFDLGAKTIIEKILPIVDNFERGFTTVEESDKEDAFVAGMSQVYKQLMTELEAVGVKPIEALGKEFDPEFHNAVMQVESEEYESGVVAQELMKGYTYKDTVVRHSMVAVVQ
ncbi:MAG: nucleotide exchange factor GrpE [Agathobacter sp.]|nr:nucleotide exchange factor GrpE [Agathobacter sp.]